MKHLTILYAPNGVGSVTASKLEKRRCLECPLTEKQSAGFVPVDDEGNYLLSIDAAHLLAAVEIQTRRVNSKAVKREAQKRLQGQEPSKRMLRDMCEQVELEFLAKTLPSIKTVMVWMDIPNKRVMVDTSSSTVADLVVELLSGAVDGLGLELPNRNALPAKLKSYMLDNSALPDGFDRGDSVVIKSPEEDSSRAAYKVFNLFGLSDETLQNSDVLELGMIYDDGAPTVFTLTSTGLIKGLKMDVKPEGDLATDFRVFAGTVAQMIKKVFA
jgi:DNA recombination-dependent growth factor C